MYVPRTRGGGGGGGVSLSPGVVGDSSTTTVSGDGFSPVGAGSGASSMKITQCQLSPHSELFFVI